MGPAYVLLRHYQPPRWDRHSLCTPPVPIAGTGKTSVANLYARLLRVCGFLSRGEYVLVKPADLKGSAVGESEKKTAAILERALGSVLVIDEACGFADRRGCAGPIACRPACFPLCTLPPSSPLYADGLGADDPYMRSVVDQLVAETPDKGGADLAVVLCGYVRRGEGRPSRPL